MKIKKDSDNLSDTYTNGHIVLQIGKGKDGRINKAINIFVSESVLLSAEGEIKV